MQHTDTKSEHLHDSLFSDVKLLISFASRQGLEVDHDSFTKILSAINAHDQGKLDEQQEKSFLEAYNRLAKRLHPVDIESIRAVTTPFASNPWWHHRLFRLTDKTVAEGTLTIYRYVTIILIALLIAVQTSWFYGNSIITEINTISNNSRISRAEWMKLGHADKKDADMKLRQDIVAKELEDYSLKYSASSHALMNWLEIMTFNHTSEVIRNLDKDPNKHILIPLYNAQKAQYLLHVLHLYILPLLYGLVGACAYILRSLSQDIKNFTFASVSHPGYLTRLLLGGLSGLAIGWFVSPESMAAAKTLSPLAIAFVAGYSVELLFAAMDKVALFFSASNEAKKPRVRTAEGK